MSDNMRWDWLDAYFSGECSSEWAREMDAWIDAAPERRQRIEALREIWTRAAHQAGGQADTRWDASAAWRRLAPTLEVPSADVKRLPVLKVTPGGGRGGMEQIDRGRRIAMRFAAAIALVVGGTVLWRAGIFERQAISMQTADLRAYTTPLGQRASFSLADGTRAVLAPGSTLRVPRDFAHITRRDVYLEGTAFFEVTHDARRPFVVHAAHGTAEDLGTKFVVTAYPADTMMRVVVEEGIVAVRGRTDATTATTSAPQVLRPGDLATIDQAGEITTLHRVAIDEYTSWTIGQLVFRDKPVREVAAELARWYDMDIRVVNPAAAAQRVTLTTEPGQPLTEVLTALTVSAGLQARWIGEQIILE